MPDPVYINALGKFLPGNPVSNDDRHFEKLQQAFKSGVLNVELSARIVKTARVTARLYALQLEELGNV